MSFDARQPAKVREATCETDDHFGVVTGWVHVTGPDEGWGQGFGGIGLGPEHAADWTAAICALFGVKTLAECTGRNCFVLHAWASWGHDIEGLEVDGRRFTLTAFRRKHWPEHPCDPLTRRKASLLADINRHGRDVQRKVAELEKVEVGYVDWSGSQTGSDPT